MSKIDNKELEEAKKILKHYKNTIDICEFTDTPNRVSRAIQVVLNYIDNSIPKEVVEKKIEELNEMYKDTNDIKIKQSIWWRKKALQELLERK